MWLMNLKFYSFLFIAIVPQSPSSQNGRFSALLISHLLTEDSQLSKISYPSAPILWLCPCLPFVVDRVTLSVFPCVKMAKKSVSWYDHDSRTMMLKQLTKPVLNCTLFYVMLHFIDYKVGVQNTCKFLQ